MNLSPSLTCDSPLDQRIKSNLIADLLTLVGIPTLKQRHKSKVRQKPSISPIVNTHDSTETIGDELALTKTYLMNRPGFPSIFDSQKNSSKTPVPVKTFYSQTTTSILKELPGDNTSHHKILSEIDHEYKRRGAFELIFPFYRASS